MDRIFWSGYTSRPRIEAIPAIEEIIGRHGFITDFRMYSDISLSLVIELEERHIDALHRDLATFLRLDAGDFFNSGLMRERVILLHLTFSQGKGDLIITVPAVPG